jgi:hypothetical protein
MPPVSRRIDVLAEALAALTDAAERLASTHDGVAALFPLSPPAFIGLSEAVRERLDAYAIRYARCQDLLFPAMRALGRAQLEPKAEEGFLELFALMQKQGVATNRDDWERQRSLRNAVSHEYPDASAIVDVLNGIRSAVPEILDCVKRLKARAAEVPTS